MGITRAERRILVQRGLSTGGVEGAAVLCDERRGGVDRGFGSALFHVEEYVLNYFIRCSK